MLRIGGLLFLLLCWNALFGQRLPKADALTIGDGLGFRDVSAIVQDREGLMWIGTRQGLNRYDGYRFIRFGSDRQADVPFPGENILLGGMCLVDDTTLWLVADLRLYALNLKTFAWHDQTAAAGVTGSVVQIKRGADGTVWLVWEDKRQQHLWRQEHGLTFRPIAQVNRLRREFNSVALDTAGNAWWSTTAGGLRLYDRQGRLMHQARPDSFVWYGTTMYFTPVFVDSRNRVFIFPKSKNQVWQYDPANGSVAVVADSLSSVVYYALEDSRGRLWIAARDQLLCLHPDGGWTDYTAVLKNALPYSVIQGLYEDRTNLLWVATDNGLLKMPVQKQLFRHYFNVPDAAWGNAMRGIFEDKNGRIYAYCETEAVGLHRLDPVSGQSTVLTPVGMGPYALQHAKHFVADPAANAVWTLTNKLLRVDLDRNTVQEVADMAEIAERFAHNPMALLHDGTFVLGGYLDRVTLFDPKNGAKRRLVADTSAGFKTIATEYFLEHEDGSIWVATASAGLFRFSRQGRILQHFSRQTRPALSNDHVLVLHRAPDGLLWIGTFGGGLNCLDPVKGIIKVFTRREGLSDNNVTGILIDAEGNIWASTYSGLSCYRQQDRTFLNFFEEDGLTNNEFNYSSSFRDHQGNLWFGGLNGVQAVRPADILQGRRNPPLCFTGFARYYQPADSLITQYLGAQHLREVAISPYDSYCQFSWALPNYFKPDKNQYYVWLEHFEAGWSFLGNTPQVRYNKLPPGRYVLHIRGADSKGNPSAAELTMAIRVRPFFYQTWWFILACGFLLAGAVFAVLRYRLRRLLEMERMRTRIASDLHDEVGSMLSGLAMQVELLELQPQKADATALGRIREISRQALSQMRDVVWSIDSRRDRVQDLLDRMREYCDETLVPRDIAVHFELGVVPMEKKLPVDTRQHLFLFFKEAITNIARHAAATRVEVRFGHFDDYFELSVRDNGSTSAKNAPSTGLGLQNMEMRAGKLGAGFQVSRQDGFEVRLRMKSI